MAHQLAFTDALSERERILTYMAENTHAYLTALRGFAQAHARFAGTVTIDDVVRSCVERDFPLPSALGMDARVLGSLFRSKEWVPVGQRLTDRAEKIARCGKGRALVTIYALREDTNGTH